MDRPPLPSANSSYGDPFADRVRHTQFADQPVPYHAPSPYQSTTSLPQDHQEYEDDEYLEKQPLAAGESFTGGFYPPGCVRRLPAPLIYPMFPQANRSQRIWRPLWPSRVRRIYLHKRHRQCMAPSPDNQAWCHQETEAHRRQLHCRVPCPHRSPQRHRGKLPRD
jgi:hypothetical protein